MKRSVVIPVVLGVLLSGVIAILLVPGREPVSLTLVQYHRWPHGATLKLTNNTTKTITFLTDWDAYTPVLFRQKTGNGWSTSPPMMSELRVVFSVQNRVGVSHTNWFYSIGTRGNSSDTGGSQNASGRLYNPDFGNREGFLQTHELKPGRSIELYFSLEPDGPPIRVGTVCIIPQGIFAQHSGDWVSRVKSWCRIKSKSTAPSQIEVWCDEPLQVSLRPTRAEGQ